MISERPFDVVHMAAEALDVQCDRANPPWSSRARFCLICACPKSCQYPTLGEFRARKKLLEFALRGNGFVVLTILNANTDALL